MGELRLIRLSSTPTNRKHRWEHENHKKWRHLADIDSIRVPASFRPETEGCVAQRTTLLWLPYRTVFTEPFALLQLRNAQVDRVFLVLDEDDALSGFRALPLPLRRSSNLVIDNPATAARMYTQARAGPMVNVPSDLGGIAGSPRPDR